MAFGYGGKRLRLVPYDRDRHYENAYLWLNNPDLTLTLGLRGTPITRDSQDSKMKELSETNDMVFFAIETLEGEHLGFSSINSISWPNGTAGTGSFIAIEALQGRGYGTEASILRARYAFDVLGLRILTSSYLEHNPASKRMLEKTGYVEYGCIPKEFWKAGEFRDMHYMMLTRERFAEQHL
jgi:RimJ/RimL family protein N-acetyltransferase